MLSIYFKFLDRQTDTSKTIYPHLSMRGHNNKILENFPHLYCRQCISPLQHNPDFSGGK